MKKFVMLFLNIIVYFLFPLWVILGGFLQFITNEYIISPRICGIILTLVSGLFFMNIACLKYTEKRYLDTLAKLSLVCLERNRLKEFLSNNNNNIKEDI